MHHLPRSHLTLSNARTTATSQQTPPHPSPPSSSSSSSSSSSPPYTPPHQYSPTHLPAPTPSNLNTLTPSLKQTNCSPPTVAVPAISPLPNSSPPLAILLVKAPSSRSAVRCDPSQWAPVLLTVVKEEGEEVEGVPEVKKRMAVVVRGEEG